MHEIAPVIGFVIAKVRALWLRPEVGGSAACFLLLLLLVPRLRREGRRDFRGYLRPEFWTDAAYAALYLGGVYAFFVSGPLRRALMGAVTRYAPFLQMDLVRDLPPIVQFLAVFAIMDGVNYWAHRALHASDTLWGFHAIHHSQRELTALTYFRLHVMDVVTRNVIQFVPLVMLGNPNVAGIPMIWLSAYVMVALEGLAHSDLGWTYGPLGSVLVSPAYHRIHHSTDARHYNRNFAAAFSFWDRLFGTAEWSAERPRAYGNLDLAVPEGFFRQIFFPFLRLVRRVRTNGAARLPGAA